MKFAIAFALMIVVGCGDPYRDAIRRQTTNLAELCDLLATVKDEASMTHAEPKIDALSGKFEYAARQAKSLAPPDRETSERVQQEYGAPLIEAWNRFRRECGRIQSLPGGPAFVERLAKSIGSS